MRKAGCTLAIVCALAMPAGAGAAPGDLDPSWGSNGIVASALDPGSQRSWRGTLLGVQSSGKIVAAGWTEIDGEDPRLVVERLEPSGALDASFAGGGSVPTNCGRPRDLLVEPDDQLLIISDDCLFRLTAAGELDGSFGGANGIVPLQNGQSVAFDEQGRIVLAEVSETTDLTVRRLDANGEADEDFGDGGAATFDPLTIYPWPSVSLATSGNRIYLAAHHQMAALDQDGALDPSFGGDGLIDVPNFGFELRLFDIKVDASGRILTAGFDYIDDLAFVSHGVVARIQPNGSPDPTYGDAGAVSVPQIGSANALLPLPDGGMMVAGSFRYECKYAEWCPGEGNASLVRISGAGAIDESFGEDGTQMLALNGLDSFSDLEIYENSKLLAGGGAQLICCGAQRARSLVTRHLLEGRTADFDADGKVDEADRCRLRFSYSRSGCPTYPRSVTAESVIATSELLEVKGLIDTPAESCFFAGRLRLEHRRSGEWREVKNAWAYPNEYQRIEFSVESPRSGLYRVLYPEKFRAGVGTCSRASFKLRVP